jgi:hypothetical protein
MGSLGTRRPKMSQKAWILKIRCACVNTLVLPTAVDQAVIDFMRTMRGFAHSSRLLLRTSLFILSKPISPHCRP